MFKLFSRGPYDSLIQNNKSNYIVSPHAYETVRRKMT